MRETNLREGYTPKVAKTSKEQSKFNGYLDLETNKKNVMLINMCSRKLNLYKYSSSVIYIIPHFEHKIANLTLTR